MSNTVPFHGRESQIDQGKQLSERLNHLPAGREACQEYQSLGIEVFDYLFNPDLIRSWQAEQPIDKRQPYASTNLKPDAMYAIDIHYKSVWTQLGNLFGSKIVTVDFKNLSGAPDREHIETMKGYLDPRIKKTIGILCTRQAPSVSAITEQNRAYTDGSQKLILTLCDKDIFKMLRMKRNRKDPVKLIERQIDEILARLGP